MSAWMESTEAELDREKLNKLKADNIQTVLGNREVEAKNHIDSLSSLLDEVKVNDDETDFWAEETIEVQNMTKYCIN